jgi:hypothetical protein
VHDGATACSVEALASGEPASFGAWRAVVKTFSNRRGGPPTLQVGQSCEAAGQGSVVLGRDKKACLGEETTAQDTLKQNRSKYAGATRTNASAW